MGRFDKLYFKDFAELALEEGLSKYNKIGFDDEYRRGYEGFIFEDVLKYLPQLHSTGKNIIDIGPGCSDLPFMLINHCKERGHGLTLVDSKEMLSHLPDYDFIRKVEGIFPECYADCASGYDVILAYSVLHHVFFEMNPFTFIDNALSLLNKGGALFIGDIPNNSKKKRNMNDHVEIDLNKDVMEDGFLFGILQRYRNAGFETYLVPHDPRLPLKHTRDNILIVRL